MGLIAGDADAPADTGCHVTREVRADPTTDTLYTHALAGRLKTVTDRKHQVTTLEC
jgi:hypothetical protein